MTCNSKCRSCGIWRLPETAKEHSGADLLAKVEGDPFLREHIESVNLSGGEPFTHPRIEKLMSGMLGNYERIKEICINTDGHLKSEIKAALAKTLPKCRERGVVLRIYISLDGIGRAHDRHRRHPGAFQLADEALNFLAEEEKKWGESLVTTASFTVTDRNSAQILPVLHYVRSLGVRVDYNLAARPEVFIGGAGLERRFQVTEEQFEQVRSAITEVCRYPDNLNFTSRYYATMLETLQSGRRSRGCFFPEKGFVLMPDGKAYICGTFLDFYFGNLLENDFETIWRGADRKSCRDNLIPGKCESCFSNSYEDWDLAVGALV
ncbi:radical SAM protein [Nocardia terpenica]|nr:radical SAM protein [Nocardia terpenica]